MSYKHGHRAKAARIRAAAAALQKKIDAKRDPAIAHQNLTPRRAAIAAGMAKEAQHLEGVQRVLLYLAELHEGAPQGWPWRGLTNAAAVERVICWGRAGRLPSSDGWNADERAKLARLGIDTDQRLVDAWECIQGAYEAKREPTREERLRELERGLIGVRIPGFFPTPAALADLVCEAAQIEDHHHVLEPSAGKGDLVEAVLRAAPGAKVTAVEWFDCLAEILSARFGDRPGVTVVHRDIDEVELAAPADRVVMNPPFEKYADRQHVLRALRFLRPGGRLVAIMGAGGASFGRGVEDFQDSLNDLCSEWDTEKLPEGCFQGAEAFRQTGVRAMLLTAVRAGGAQ